MTDYKLLVAKHGGVLQAARAIGKPRAWLRRRLSGEVKSDLSNEDTQIERLTKALAAARGAKVEPIPRAKVVRKGVRETVRVIIPDSHGDSICRPAAAAMLADIKRLNPDEIIMLGDALDCGGFLAQHHTLGYVAESERTFEADVKACNEFLDLLQNTAKSASITYIEGNHESRIEKWCITAALRNARDARFLLDRFGPEAVLSLKNRGIKYIKTSERYDDLPIPGTIRRGKCYFTHGIGHGKHATHQHVTRFGASVVHGHTHRAQSSIIRLVDGGVVGAWCPGTLSQLQPFYMHTSITDWSHGYGVQFVQSSGEFMHINVPIVNGQSMLPLHMKGA